VARFLVDTFFLVKIQRL